MATLPKPKVLELAMNPDESMVTYTSKELFLEVNRKLDLVLAEQGRKADKMDLDKLESRVEQHTQQLLVLTTTAATKVSLEQAASRQRWLMAGVTVSLLGVAADLLIRLFVH